MLTSYFCANSGTTAYLETFDASLYRSSRIADPVRARRRPEACVTLPVPPGRASRGSHPDVQRSSVPTAMELLGLPALHQVLRRGLPDPRGELHPRGYEGRLQHRHRAQQHVPAATAHRSPVLQRAGLPYPLAHIRVDKGA